MPKPIVAKAIGLAGLLGLASAATTAAWALRIAPRKPVLERVSIPLPSEHRHLAGLRIGFLTDSHIGPTFRPADLAPAVHLLANEQPDLMLLGGDYASESPRYAGLAAAAISPLADVPLGAYAVLGNHDMECGATKVADALEVRGFRVLRNAAVPIETGNGTLWIAGIDEVTHYNHDAEGTFAQIPDGAAILALWHEPDLAEQAAERGAFAQLSGHTHGGQVRFPIIGPLVLPRFGRKYVRGVIPVNAMTLYVSRGAGVYRPPVRFRCPPEVTLITLMASSD